MERFLQRELGSHELREEREVESAPDHRGGGERRATLGRKAVDSREYDLPDRFGDHDRDRVVEAPIASITSDQRPGIDKRTYELFEVEGIAVCRLEYAALKLVGQCSGPDQLVQESALGLGGEWFEGNLPDEVREVARRRFLERPRCVVAFVPLGGHKQHSSSLDDRQEGPQ